MDLGCPVATQGCLSLWNAFVWTRVLPRAQPVLTAPAAPLSPLTTWPRRARCFLLASPGRCARKPAPAPLAPTHREQFCARPRLDMTSVTIRTQDGPLGLSQRILSPNLSQGPARSPLLLFPSHCARRRKTGFPRLRSLECIMKSPGCERKGLCVCA